MGTWEGFWSERAGKAEQDSDRLAALLEQLVIETNFPDRLHYAVQDALRDYMANREARYRALPAGPTLAGHLSSGGYT